MPAAVGMAKPVEDAVMHPSSTCTAAFTSSQQNMAFTAAMVIMPPTTPKPMEQQLEEHLLGPPIGVEPVAPPIEVEPVAPPVEVEPVAPPIEIEQEAPPSLTPTTSAEEVSLY